MTRQKKEILKKIDEIETFIAVDDELLWPDFQLVDSSVHSQDAGLEDVDLIDFLCGDDAHSPIHCVMLNFFPELIAHLLVELLGIIEPFILVVGRKDDRSGIHASCQASSSCLVASSFYDVFIQIG